MTTENKASGGGTVKRTRAKTKPASVEPQAPALPPPDEEERAQAALAARKYIERPPPFAVRIAPIDGHPTITPPHNDVNIWVVRSMSAFGSRSPHFSDRMLGHLATVARPPGSARPTEQSLNAASAFVDGFSPENEREAMAASLLYATNDLALEMVVRAKQATDVENLELSGNLAVKLMRSATAQAEALAKIRRGGEQTVRVEHVHVHAGGQAIVGNVAQGGGVPETIKEQSRAKPVAAIDYAAPVLAPLWSEDAARDALPIASDVERALSDARRH